MIIAWVSYTVVVSLLLFAGAIAAEFVSRALGRATRVVWCAAICLSIGLSARALVHATQSTVSPAVQVETARASEHSAARTAASPTPTPPARRTTAERVIGVGRSALELPGRAILWLTSATSTRADRPMIVGMMVMAAMALFYLLLVARRFRNVAERLEVADIHGYHVLVSEHLGPALLGITRARIVIPRWFLSLGETERRVILAHEQQHVDAGDPAMLAAAAILLALAPWNLALWAMFGRLRLAIEADCDRRVLASQSDVRRYGDLLVTVYERSAAAGAMLAFGGRQSNLERRIRWLVGRAPRLGSRQGVSALAVTAVLVAVACSTEAPTRSLGDSGGAEARASMSAASVVGVVPRCIQPKEQPTPSYDELRSWARQRHPSLFDPNGKGDTVIGFLLDENCVIQHDTVLAYPNKYKWTGSHGLLATVFPDSSDLTRNRGMAFAYVGPERRIVTIAYAVKPSVAWRTRLSRTPCGIGVRFDERCALHGPLAVRMVDSVRALVAIRRFGQANRPVDDLFLITLSRPSPALVSQTMAHGVVVYQSGALYVEDFLALQPLLWIGTSSSTGLGDLKRKRDVRVIDQLIGISHYRGNPLTLEQVAGLKPASRCDGPAGSCYEVAGHTIEFPM